MIFGGAFWSHFQPRDSRAFEELLKRPDVTLEEVLDQEDTVQEMKNQNTALLDLYSLPSFTPERFLELLDFVITEPPSDSSHTRAYKAPFIACELLTSDVPQITARLLEAGDAQSRLFAFLQRAPINPTLAGYFEKILSMLLARGPEVILTALYGPQPLSAQLVLLIDSPSLAQVLLKSLLCESTEYLDQRRDIIQGLVSQEISQSRCMSVACTLCELISTGNSSQQWKELAPVLYSSEVFTSLFTLFTGKNDAAKAAGRVLVTLISSPFFRVAVCRQQKLSEDMTVTEEEDQSEFLTSILTNCVKLQETLENSQEMEISTSFLNEKTASLGELRLLCAEIVLALTRVDIQQITSQLGKVGVFSTLTSLFFQYHWNSFLHGFYYQICTIIINSPVLEIRTVLTLDTNLAEMIANYEPDLQLSSGEMLRKGQRGFITRIAAMLVKAAETHGDLEEVLSRVSNWQNYLDKQLNPILEIENRPGPESRVQTHQTEEDDDFDVQIDVESRESDKFPFIYPGDSHEPQIADDFEEGIPVGEDLNVGDLESDDLFDLNEKGSPFRACLKGSEAKDMLVEGEELRAAKHPQEEVEEGRHFNSRDYWRLPYHVITLPDLD